MAGVIEQPLTASRNSAAGLDAARLRREFPILDMRVNGRPLVYLDNAATTQKPRAVIEAIQRYYTRENANIHRGIHHLSQLATARHEEARRKAARFLGATVECEIVFTRGATEAINLVAQSYGRTHVGPGDEVLITHMEHHSNLVPWQALCRETGAALRVVPIDDHGNLIMAEFDRLLSERTKIVAVVHVSNALGTVNPVREIARKAHGQGAVVLVDGAQSAPHMAINVREIGCDFFVCSGHKMYGPTGIGVLYGRGELLEGMPPYQLGGDMILSVSFEETLYNHLPHKFEAGTPHIEGAIGLGAAIDFLETVGMESIAAYERELLVYGTNVLQSVPGLRLMGQAREKAGVLAFTMESAHPHDIGEILNSRGIAIRAGHHCAQPVMQRYGVPATARASLALYNTRAEIDALADALHEVNRLFA